MSQIYARQNRRLFEAPGTADGVAEAFGSLQPSGRAIVGVSDTARMVMVKRRRDGTWKLVVMELAGSGAGKSRRSGALDVSAARQTLTRYVTGDPNWETTTQTRLGFGSRSTALLIPLTFGVCTVLALIGMQLAGTLEGFEWSSVPMLVVGVGMISAVTVYADVFFSRIRPRVAARVGRRLGVEVVEDQRHGWFSEPGLWTASGGTPMSRLKASFADLAVLFIGVFVPISAFIIAVALIADRVTR